MGKSMVGIFEVGKVVWIIVDRLPLSVVEGVFMGVYEFVSEDHYFVKVGEQIIAVKRDFIFLSEKDARGGLVDELNTRLRLAEDLKVALRRDVNNLSDRVTGSELKIDQLLLWAERRLIKPLKVRFVEVEDRDGYVNSVLKGKRI